MYSACIFCYGDLGSNEALESLPIGKRVAFDPSAARLWVICARCGRWNLSPLEERWEAVEEAERAYEQATLRGHTDNIALAKASDGTDLIRIGRAPRREVAAWRYGDRFLKRWRRSVAYGVIFTGAVVGVMVTGSYGALTALPGGTFLLQAPSWFDIIRSRRRIVARIQQPDGSHAVLRGKHIGKTRLRIHPTEDWSLSVQHEAGGDELRGTEALHVASAILARVNREGGRRKTVETALAKLDAFPTPSELFRHYAEKTYPTAYGRMHVALDGHTRADRLALEMVAHDGVEREALSGELRYLERAWREADSIAAIADNLLIPESVQNRFDTLSNAGRRTDRG